MALNRLPQRQDGILVPDRPATLVVTAPQDLGGVVPVLTVSDTLVGVAAQVDGLVLSWRLTAAQVNAALAGSTGPLEYEITAGAGDDLVPLFAGYLVRHERWDSDVVSGVALSASLSQTAAAAVAQLGAEAAQVAAEAARVAAEGAQGLAEDARDAAVAAVAPAAIDAVMADQVTNPTGATGMALSSTYATHSDVGAVAERGSLTRIVSLIAGTEDETPIISGGTYAADTMNWKIGGQGWKITTAGASTAVFSVDPLPGGDPLEVGPIQAVCAWIYVPDAAKVTDLGLYLYHDDALTSGQRWAKSATQNPLHTITTGWNFVRVPANATASSTTSVNAAAEWGTLYRAAIVVSTNAATDVTVGHYYAEVPEKAKVLMLADRGYKSFYENGYPDLVRLGVPVTWAPDITLFGSLPGTINEAMTEAQMHQVALENGNSISFHGWDGGPTSAMTAAQVRADTMKAIRWLQRHGYSGRMWRASWVQQLATNAAAAHDLLLGCATSTARTDPIPWPPANIMEIPRATLDRSITAAQVDARFAWLKKTHQTEVCFIHRVNTDAADSFGCSQDLWDHYVSKLETGITEGWLEGVTFEQLFFRHGGRFESTGGAHVARYVDAAGNMVTKNVL